MAELKLIREILKDDHKLDVFTFPIFNDSQIKKRGFIKENELEPLMQNLANLLKVAKPSQKEISLVFKELDLDGDGNLSFDEFKVLVKIMLSLVE